MNKLVAVVGINAPFILVAACERNRGNSDGLGTNGETGGNGTRVTMPDNGNGNGSGTSADGTTPDANHGSGDSFSQPRHGSRERNGLKCRGSRHDDQRRKREERGLGRPRERHAQWRFGK